LEGDKVMKVTNWYYFVVAEDTSGNAYRIYHFYDEADACRFALANENIISYGLPSVYQMTYTYNPAKLQREFYREVLEELDIKKIRSYGSDERRN
jgi:hypothetical protein